jgi:hypothetical protein
MLELPEEHELIAFFECEPQLLDTEVVWAYNELRFTTVRGSDKVVVEISAGWGELSVSWERDGQQLAWLKLINLEKLQVEMQRDDELLVTTGTHGDQNATLILRLKPVVAIKFKQEPV